MERPDVKPQPTSWRAIIWILTDPIESFEKLTNARPSYLPYYLASGTLLLFFLISFRAVSQALETELVSSGVDPGVAQALQTSGMVGGTIGALTGPWVTGLIVSGLVYLLLQLAGAPARFRAVFSVVGYANLPTLVERFLRFGLGIAGLSNGHGGATVLNASIFVPEANPFVASFLSLAAPFDLWALALLVIGAAALARVHTSKMIWLGAIVLTTNWLLLLGGELVRQ